MDIFILISITFAFIILILIILFLVQRLRMEKIVESKSREIFRQWVETSLETERNEIKESLENSIRKEYELKFDQWKNEYSEKIKSDTLKRSQDVLKGKVTEQLFPYFQSFPYDPRDAKFIGSPIDLIVFSGLREKDYVDEIVFIEIKTGKSKKSNAEKAVEDAVLNKRISFKTINIEQ
ncbi:MAG: Holliday junction resolvase-like protein [Thermoplasmata archaeon]|nr:Holliday junction resolvase-like protein [Thermoplasmata archaeon]